MPRHPHLRHHPPATMAQAVPAAPETAAQFGVGQDLRCDLEARHEDWLRQQYLRDLAVLERCERQIEEQAGRPVTGSERDMQRDTKRDRWA